MLLTGSLFARFTSTYEILLNPLCAGALVVVRKAVPFHKYFYAVVGVAFAVRPSTRLSRYCCGEFHLHKGFGRGIRGWEAAAVKVALNTIRLGMLKGSLSFDLDLAVLPTRTSNRI